MPKTNLYRNSFEEAERLNELELWKKSHKDNIALRDYIDSSETGLHATAYKDNCLDKSYAQKLVDEWGFDRTLHVLANHISHHMYDKRFSIENKNWVSEMFGWQSNTHTQEYISLNAHAGLIDLLTKNVRQLYSDLCLFDAEDCIENSKYEDYTGKIVVLRDTVLKEEYRNRDNQLWLAESGFGCETGKIGTKVFVTSLADGEQTHFNRQDFVGIIKPEMLPDWAKENLENLDELKKEYEKNHTSFGINM